MDFPSGELCILDTMVSNATIHSSQAPLYVSLIDYNLCDDNISTRSASDNIIVSLESLIDRSKTVSATIGDVSYKQIPFIQNSQNIFASIHHNRTASLDSATIVRKYLIEAYSKRNCNSDVYVATMITKPEYYFKSPDHVFCFDFLNKSNYSGIILFSSVEWNLRTVHYYQDGKIAKSHLLTHQDLKNNDSLMYLSLFSGSVTKDCDTLTPSICIAYVNNWLSPSFCIADSDCKSGHNNKTDNSSSPGGGVRPLLQNSYDSSAGVLQPMFGVSVETNIPDEISMFGSGTYCSGTFVPINVIISTQKGSHLSNMENFGFRKWVGDLEEWKTYHFLLKVDKDYISTAIFNENIPCQDTIRDVGNPLVEMNVAATKSGSYANGLFGGRGGKHQGLDIRAV